MLAPEGNLTFWASNWTATLHRLFCNDTLLECAGECGTGPAGFDHLCTSFTPALSTTLFCTPCNDHATCNVSLLLDGLESIEGVFLSRIPTRECNGTFLEEEVRFPPNQDTEASNGLKEA